MSSKIIADQQGLAVDKRQLGVPDFASILASGSCAPALTVSAVCCKLKPDPLGDEMNRCFLVVGLMAAFLIGAAEPYPVDWPALERAWDSYLAEPSAQRATRIQELLPAGRRASDRVEDTDVGATTRILDRLGELQPVLAKGAPHAFDIAFALREISDGSYSEWLSEMLGASARRHPVELLRSLKANEERQSTSCNFVVAADPDQFDTTEKYRAEIAARRDALAAVTEPDLEEPRTRLLKVLNRALEPSS